MSLPAEESGPSTPRRRRFITFNDFLIALLIIAAIVGILELIPANYYMLLPGQALPVESMIDVQGHPPLRGSGRLYMTDVTLYKVNHLLEELYGRINPNAELDPATSFSGGLSENQYLKLNDQLMTDSVHQAEAAALNATPGYHLRCSAQGPKIVFTVPKTPAAGALKVGDVIEAINGQRIHCAAAVSTAIKKLRPGDKVHLSMLRHGRLLHLTVSTIPSTNGQPDKHGKTPLIGVYVQDQFIFPVKITIHAGNIGGPSAGLMFSLGIVQRLEGRDLTKGCKVAGTGTITFNGQVGEIGGAKQKIIAARQAGAKYFLVPNVPANLKPARSSAGNVKVLPVSTLQQALRDLQRIKPCR